MNRGHSRKLDFTENTKVIMEKVNIQAKFLLQIPFLWPSSHMHCLVGRAVGIQVTKRLAFQSLFAAGCLGWGVGENQSCKQSLVLRLDHKARWFADVTDLTDEVRALVMP